MWRLGGRIGSGLAACVFLMAFAGCNGPLICTAIGADSGVDFNLGLVLPATALPATVHACVRTSASRAASGRSPKSGAQTVSVGDRALQSTAPVLARLRVVTANGQVAFDTTARVPLTRVQPNGPKCPPIAFEAAVTATAAGTLELAGRSSGSG